MNGNSPGVSWGCFFSGWFGYFCSHMLRYTHFQNLLIVLFVLVLGTTLAITVFLINTPHAAFIQLLVLVYQIPEKAPVIAGTYLTPYRYEVLKYTLVAFAMAIPVAGLFLFIHVEWLYRQAWGIYRFIRSVGKRLTFYQLLSHTERRVWWGVLVGLLALRTGAAWYVPVHTDEAYSFLFVADHGVLASLSYYPGPNNHVAFSLLCALGNKTGLPPLWAMRLPALCIAVIFYWAVSAMLIRRAGFLQGMLAILFFSFTDLGLFYSFHGRGYYLLALCAAVALIALWKYAKGNTIIYLWVFVLASVTGFYTIPVFLFPFFTWLVFGLLLLRRHRNTHRIQPLMLATMGIALWVLGLYLPIILFNGWEALFANRWVAPMPRPDFWEALPAYALEWLSVGYPNLAVGIWVKGVALGSWVLGAWLTARKGATHCWLYPIYGQEGQVKNNAREDKIIGDMPVLLVCAYLVAAGMVVVMGVLPFGRVWIYLVMLESILAVLGLYGCVKYLLLKKKSLGKYKKTGIVAAYATVCFWAIFQSSAYYKEVNDPANPYQAFREVAHVIQQNPGRQYLIDHSLYHVLVGFESRARGQKIWIESQPKQSGRYDYAMLRRDSTLKTSLSPDQYEAILENPEITLYRLKR